MDMETTRGARQRTNLLKWRELARCFLGVKLWIAGLSHPPGTPSNRCHRARCGQRVDPRHARLSPARGSGSPPIGGPLTSAALDSLLEGRSAPRNIGPLPISPRNTLERVCMSFSHHSRASGSAPLQGVPFPLILWRNLSIICTRRFHTSSRSFFHFSLRSLITRSGDHARLVLPL
jgi:hypothetical protein